MLTALLCITAVAFVAASGIYYTVEIDRLLARRSGPDAPPARIAAARDAGRPVHERLRRTHRRAGPAG